MDKSEKEKALVKEKEKAREKAFAEEKEKALAKEKEKSLAKEKQKSLTKQKQEARALQTLLLKDISITGDIPPVYLQRRFIEHSMSSRANLLPRHSGIPEAI